MSDEENAVSGGPRLDRRRLLGAAGAPAASAATAGHAAESLLLSVAQPATGAPSPAGGSFELEELTILDLQRGMSSGKWSSRRLVELYLERIQTVDRGPSGTNAVAETNPDA